MDKRTALIMFVVAILTHQGMNHEEFELPGDQETSILSRALVNAGKIIDADLHSHKERSSSLDQAMGHEADESAISGRVSVSLTGQEMRMNPVRRNDVRYGAGVSAGLRPT
jgi:hypothetical protein